MRDLACEPLDVLNRRPGPADEFVIEKEARHRNLLSQRPSLSEAGSVRYSRAPTARTVSQVLDQITEKELPRY